MESDMIFTKELFHRNDINLNSEIIERKAVRAVIYKNKRLLLVYAEANDEYKFPGGGIEKDESEIKALSRELEEEIGGTLLRVKRKIGTINEFNKAEADINKVFKMISNYYEVEIFEELKIQNLDDYEKNLAFKPEWVTIKEAILKNENTIKTRKEEKSKWIERETIALKELDKILQ